MIAVLMTQLIASRARWLSWMDSVLVVYLGTISYSTYLYHKMAVGFVFRALHGPPHRILIVPALIAIYIVSSISYFVVEKPFLRLRALIENRTRRTGVAPAPAG
jgi:peptidoglycan/LPS O-acetylase OafA/YrhL